MEVQTVVFEVLNEPSRPIDVRAAFFCSKRKCLHGNFCYQALALIEGL